MARRLSFADYRPGSAISVLERQGIAAQGTLVSVFGQVLPSSESWGPRMDLELGLGNDSELASYLFLTTFMMLGNSLFCDPVPHP